MLGHSVDLRELDLVLLLEEILLFFLLLLLSCPAASVQTRTFCHVFEQVFVGSLGTALALENDLLKYLFN